MTNPPTRQSIAKPWTEQEDALLRLHSSKPINDILPHLPGRTRQAIYIRLHKRLGVAVAKGPDPKAWSAEDVAYLHASYGKVPSDELCAKLRRNEHTITEYARRKGLTLPKDENGDTVNTVGKAALRRLLDDSLQSYYWIGYLMADGYMHHGLGQIVLVSAELDKEHMAAYASYLGAKCHRYTGPSGFTGLLTDHYRVSVAERRIAHKIAERFDWKPRKTYNPPNPERFHATLTDDQFLALLIGFIDGDGHITPAFGIRVENHASWIEWHQAVLDRLLQIGISPGREAEINSHGYSNFSLGVATTRYLKAFITKHNLTVLVRKWHRVNLT